MIHQDIRDIRTGKPIPREQYSDQPYLVKADDGHWVCVITTARGREGAAGEHVGITRSADRGGSWSPLQFLEPADAPESAYAVLLKIPCGRIYCFYNFNRDNLRRIESSEGLHHRVDMQGVFVFRYSDDHGQTWSERYEVPIRETRIDRENPYGGKIRFFWTVGKPFLLKEAGYIPIHKIGDMLTVSEGWVLRCGNLTRETDPGKLIWETLPNGDVGLNTPPGGGSIAEEQSMVALSDGSLYCVYRTVDGFPAESYSRDGGYTWELPRYKRYDDGRLMRHPRAANFVWKCLNGKYLYWYHNNGGAWYDDRNPVFVCGGLEADSPRGKVIRWTQPEVLLYDQDPYVLISYPDLLEDGGRYYVTETQKLDARVHELDASLLEGLWGQLDGNLTPGPRPILSLPSQGEEMPREAVMPRLPEFLARDANRADYGSLDLRQGFSLELWMELLREPDCGVILDSRASDGQGLCLRLIPERTLEILLSDGRTQCVWQSDPDMLTAGKPQHVVITVDGGPKIISFVINGRFCDGGTTRQFGWGRFSPHLRHANGDACLRIGGDGIRMNEIRIYDVALRTSQAIGNFRAGCGIKG